jgi:DNA-directed RNA polymerase specialized sigma24 family protein
MPHFILSDSENPGVRALKEFLYTSLVQYGFDKAYQPDDILNKAIVRREQASPGSVVEIQIALLKTASLEILQELDLERAANKHNFNIAVQALFDDSNPDASPFCAGVSQMLYRFRLSQTYLAREIITEAYVLGIEKIESGTFIQIPLAWLRKTCFNVIRDLRRQQDKAENPKLDPTLCEPGDAVFSTLIVQEDWKALRLAVERLTPAEQRLLYIRICEGVSWQTVSGLTLTIGEEPLSAGTARQRGSRALKKLRQHYDLLRDTVEMPHD